MVEGGGEIHVTHRDDYPYKRWEVEELARQAGLILKEKAEFSRWNYPGYSNKRGSTSRGDSEFPLKECFTFKFIKIYNEQKPLEDTVISKKQMETLPTEHSTWEDSVNELEKIGSLVLDGVELYTLDHHFDKSKSGKESVNTNAATATELHDNEKEIRGSNSDKAEEVEAEIQAETGKIL